MSTTVLVIIGLTVVVILFVLVLGSRGRGGGRVDMVPLSNESRDRYLADWDRIEMRFVDAPKEAVSEADALVMAVLRERRHPLEVHRLPKDVQEARRDASMEKGDRTEGMRQAMLHYRAAMERIVGAPVHTEREGRREMA